MPANGSPITPRKERPQSRQIVRWTDEKLAFCFAEFRLACQRNRIDIKKPLDEAAKAIAPFVTGDALIQQLSKRRTRYLEDLKKAEDETQNKVFVPQQQQLVASPTFGRRNTPKRQKKTAIQHELEQLGDGTIVSDQVANTPASSAKRIARRSVKKDPIQKIKEEVLEEEAALKQLSDGSNSDSDSEYNESPAKPKKKRVRGKRASVKKPVPHYHSAEVDDFETGGNQQGEREYIDEAGGVNVVVQTDPPLNENSPTAQTIRKHYDIIEEAEKNARARELLYLYNQHREVPAASSATTIVPAEDVFVAQHDTQHLPSHGLPSFGPGGQSGNHMAFSYLQNDSYMTTPFSYGVNGVGTVSEANNHAIALGNTNEHSTSASDGSQEHAAGAQNSFDTTWADNQSFTHHSFGGSQHFTQMPTYSETHFQGSGNTDHSFHLEEGDVYNGVQDDTPNRRMLATNMDVFNM